MSTPTFSVEYSTIVKAKGQGISETIKWASQSLIGFTTFTKPDFQVSWHHALTAKYLMKWIKGDIQNLIISEPPRHGKTELASLRTPAFIHGRNPNARIISTSYGDTLASKNNRAVQKIIDSEAYRLLFPSTKLNGDRGNMAKGRYLRNSSEFEIVNHLGTYRSAGIGGGITGTGADYLLIDDPIKNQKQAESEVYREEVWNWWLSTALTRLEKDSKALLIMTRWHEDDLAGRLLEQAESDPNALQWTELRLPAIKEDDSNPEDPREIGDALWPEKYPIERLEMLRNTLGPRWFESLFQQNPTALEGGIIKNSWIQYYTELQAKFEKLIMSTDANFKKGNTNDFVVVQIWGKAGRFYYLLDQWRERAGFVRTVDETKKLILKWPMALRKVIETKANGDAIIDQLQHEKISGVVGYNPGSNSKSARLESVSTFFRAGDILFPHPSIAPWVQNNVHEIVKFPNAKHDDTVDATTQALIDMIGISTDWLSDMINM
jgi:predicted phage terminase large subunit-like protein